MPRRPRGATAEQVFHVVNRSAGRRRLFHHDQDYLAFLRVLTEAARRVPMRLLAYCVMPNHWHLVVRPRKDGDLSDYMGWVGLTHTMRWHAVHGTAGSGPIYQGRFKSFPVQQDEHFLTVCRYVERNPLQARLVERAEDWKWSSLAARLGRSPAPLRLHPWPVPCPPGWLDLVNEPMQAEEVEGLRAAMRREVPYGDSQWVERTADELHILLRKRRVGRPRKESHGGRRASDKK